MTDRKDMGKIEDWRGLGHGFAVAPSYTDEAKKLEIYHPFDFDNRKFDVQINGDEKEDFVSLGLAGDWPPRAVNLIGSLELRVEKTQDAIHKRAFSKALTKGFTRIADPYLIAYGKRNYPGNDFSDHGFWFQSLHVAMFERDEDKMEFLLGRLIWAKVKKDSEGNLTQVEPENVSSLSVTGWSYIWK